MKDVAIVMDLHEFAPVGGRAAKGLHRRWFEWFAEVCQDFPDRPRPRPRDEYDKPDVAAAGGARKWNLLPRPRHQLGRRIRFGADRPRNRSSRADFAERLGIIGHTHGLADAAVFKPRRVASGRVGGSSSRRN